ncbi:hypothetical protein [Virgibacillus sp. YIM 98842]|uniref:hypothetical protein n=1 Tax=Virgibacillus sp. YIM 98842 TaxID=2663533 RepID=UPI0013DB9D52|nr:hypothetical protein [Virgibacillus sp. YIM 98842]
MKPANVIQSRIWAPSKHGVEAFVQSDSIIKREVGVISSTRGAANIYRQIQRGINNPSVVIILLNLGHA